MSKKTILIGDFSKSPFGRNKDDGQFNGQRFRVENIVPALNEYDTLEVDLDSGVVAGYEYGSSFLHEVFGGLVLHEGFTEEILKKKLIINTSFEDVEVELWEYIHAPDKYI